MKYIQQVSCSLNLGSIYSIDYSFDPKSGTSIKLFFVREDGLVDNYIPQNNPTKAFIQVGGASFAMYPVRAGVQLSAGRRVQWVEFIDDTYKLNRCYIALPGRGCGTNVTILGAPVDTRTPAQKLSSAVDKVAQQIKELTQFPDYEYSFNDFLTVLRTKFTVTVNAFFNGTITQAFEGSFSDVLSNWCNYYNLSFFFENGIIKIFDPTRLTITMPLMPADAISYETEYDITSTYGKTVCNWFQQDGGEYPLSQTSDASGPLLVRTNTLWPVGHEYGLVQNTVDLNQVVASMYGQNYWFLYNYYKGTTADQCGWSPILPSDIIGNPSVVQSVAALNGTLVAITPGVAEARFTAYQQYGQEIAGRWYLSPKTDDLTIDKTYSWFNETQGQIFNFTGVGDREINLVFLTPNDQKSSNIIDGTAINQYYSGVNSVGNRVVYRDDYAADLTQFSLGALQGIVDTTYEALVGIQGSNSVDFSSVQSVVSGAQIIAHQAITIPQSISSTFGNFEAQFSGFQPRFKSVPIKGIRTADYVTLQASQSEPNDVSIVNGNSGPNVVTNTSVLKTIQAGSYTVYYNKYAKCGSASTPDIYFDYQFDARQISTDNQVGVTFSKQSKNSYRLTRDYAYINNLVNNPLLPTLAQPRTFPTWRISYTLNYFQFTPINFITNGLVGLSVSVGDGGVTATYSYSNDVLRVPDKTNDMLTLAQNMKNTWTRTYRPKELLQ